MNWKLMPVLLLCFLLLASIQQSPVAASNSENIPDDSQEKIPSLPETSPSVQFENNLSGTSTIVGGPENYPEFSQFDSAMGRSARTLDNFAATLQKLFDTLPRLGEAILDENSKDEIFGAYDPWAENYEQTLQRLKDYTPKMIDAFDNLVEKLSIFASEGIIPDTYVPVFEKEVVRLRGWFDNLIMAADGLADHLSRLGRDALDNCEALGQITDEILNSIQEVRDAIDQLVASEELLNLSENSDHGDILGDNDEPEVGLGPENIPELERYNEAVISFAGAMDDLGVVIAVLDSILPAFRDFGPTESLGEVLPLYEQQLSEYESTLQTLKEVLSEKDDSFSALIARFSEFAAVGALPIDEVQELEETAIDHRKWAENLTAAADGLADQLNTIYDSVTENSNSSCINIAKEILNDGLHSLVNAWETLTGPTDGTCTLTPWVSNSTPEPGQYVTLYVQVYHDCEWQADDHRLTGSVYATIPGVGSVSMGSFDLGYLGSTTLTRGFTAPQIVGDYSIGVTASYTHTWSTLETIWVPYYITYTWTEWVPTIVLVPETRYEWVWLPGVPFPVPISYTVWVPMLIFVPVIHEETVFGGYRQEQVRRSHSESGDVDNSVGFSVVVPVDFSLRSSDVTVPVGDSASTTVIVTLLSGPTQNVELSGNWVGTAPAGISASFRPTSGYPLFISTLTFTADSDASVGSFTYRITGSGDGITKTVDITVTIVQISLSGAEDCEVPWSKIRFITLYTDTGNHPPKSVWLHIDDKSWGMSLYSWKGAPYDWVAGAEYFYIWETTPDDIGIAHTCYFEALDAYGKTTITDTFQVKVRKRRSEIRGSPVQFYDYNHLERIAILSGWLQDLDFSRGIGSAEVKIEGGHLEIPYPDLPEYSEWYEVTNTYTTSPNGYFVFHVQTGLGGIYKIYFEGNNKYFEYTTGYQGIGWYYNWGGKVIGTSFAEAPAKADGDYTGYLSEDITSNYHKSSVNEGGTLTISMTPGSDYDLYLYNPNKELVASSTLRGDDLEEDITYTATMPGYHYIEVRRVSGSGAYCLSISGTQEVTPPETPILHEIHYKGRWTNENSPFWYWFTYDPESGIAQYEVYCSWTDTTFYTSDENYHLTLADGPHYIKVRAQNGVGLWSDWSSEAWVYIDTVPPVSSVNKIEPYWHRESTFIITASASDELSDVENVALWYRYSAGNSVWGPWSEFDFDNEEPWSWEFDVPEGDGYYEFYTIATDKTGNIETTPENVDAQAGVDTLPPVSFINSISPYWQNSGMVPFEVTATASDNLSGVASVELFYRYSPDNIVFGSWVFCSTDNEEPWSWTFEAPEGDGYYEFHSIVTDEASNVEEEPEVADTVCGIDTVPPESSVDRIEPYWQNAEMVPFDITATALELTPPNGSTPSGMMQVKLHYRYSTDNLSWSEWMSYEIDNDSPYFWTFDAPEGDGYYEFCTVATDVAFNTEPVPDQAKLKLGVDTTQPISSVDPIESYWQESTSFAVSVTALDALSGVADVELYYQSSIDNVNWSEWKLLDIDNVAPYEWSFTAPDGYGLYQFYSVATDVAGNVENAPEAADAICCVVIPAEIDIDPDTLNLKSQGRWITAYIELPGVYDLVSIDLATITLDGVAPAEPRPTEIGDHDGDGTPDLIIKFDRSAVQSLVSVGEPEIVITGNWHAVLFKGSDTIRVIEPGREQRGNRPEVPPGQSDEHLGKRFETPPGQSGEHPSQGQGPPETPLNQNNQGNQD